MPLPSDPKVIQLGNDVIAQFDSMFGVHPGYRPVHAKGVLLIGTFTPSPEAASLTRAPHATRDSTPVSVRFSDGTGLPSIPDNDANANPRGIAIRFHLADHVHTDLIGHSTDGFPTRTAEEFLEFLRAAASSGPSVPSPSPVEKFLAAHPAALAFVQASQSSPSSFAREAYFVVTSFKLVNRDGVARFGRFRITPRAGVEHLDQAAARARSANYLFEELDQRIAAGPIRFDLDVQIAGEGDVVEDATVRWPESRQRIRFGTIVLTGKAPNGEPEQQHIIFDPVPRVDGIEASADPLFEARSAIYLMSGRRRRQAADPQTRTSGR